MINKIKKITLFLIFLAFSVFGWSQSIDTGLQGIVLNEAGEPVAAASIYLSSPSFPGVHLALTEKSGFFYVPGLLPGNYNLLAEKPGYKSIFIDSILLRPGQTIFLKIKLTKAEKEGEVSISKSAVGGDITSLQNKIFLDSSLFNHLPLGRNLSFLLKAAPFVALAEFGKNETIVLGDSEKSSIYRFDGLNLTDNLTLTPATDLDSAIIESLDITSSAQSLGQIPAGSTYINLLSKSGSNNFQGTLGLLISQDSWNQDLWSASELTTKGIAAVSGLKSNFEPFINLGGRFWSDRAWFFLSGQHHRFSLENTFPGPYKDVHGQQHESYDHTCRLTSGFFKITLRPIAEALASAWINYSRSYEPARGDFSRWLPFLSTSLINPDEFISLNASGRYLLDRWTIIGGRLGYFRRTVSALLQEEAQNKYWSDDRGDRFGPLTGAMANQETRIEQITGEAEARKFLARSWGFRHILRAGLNFHQTITYLDWWRANNLAWFLDSRRANNYYFGKEGLVGFWLCGPVKNSTLVRGQIQRLGGYVGDALIINNRLTLDLSLRVDRFSAGFSGASKAASGNPLAYFVGESVIKPLTNIAYPDLYPHGLNPWGVLSFADRGDFLSWLSFSPRLGLVINLWKEGKTLIKGSWAIYHDDFTPKEFLPLHPLYPNFIPFFWLDANGNGQPDIEDEYTPHSFDFRSLSNTYFDKRVAADLTSPRINEVSLGAEHYFNSHLVFNCQFIYRQEKNIMADTLYDPASEKPWYLNQGEGEKYWLPFTTTLPATNNFPAQRITFFVRANNAPYFLQWRNVPELERKYRAIVFTLDKKMQAHWALLATLILSRTEGNTARKNEFSEPWRKIIDANYFINRYGRLETDRPVLFKLQAAFELPWGFNLGLFYQYQHGRPWERRVWILPPAEWCQQKGGERVYYEILLEPAGNRRDQPFSFLDLRLEKSLLLGSNRLAILLDVLNLLGLKKEIVGLNDVDIWEPFSEGADKAGKLFFLPDYQLTRELLGKRVIQFTFKFTF